MKSLNMYHNIEITDNMWLRENKSMTLFCEVQERRLKFNI